MQDCNLQDAVCRSLHHSSACSLGLQVTEVVGHELLDLMQQSQGGLLGQQHSWVASEDEAGTAPPQQQVRHSITQLARLLERLLSLNKLPHNLRASCFHRQPLCGGVDAQWPLTLKFDLYSKIAV